MIEVISALLAASGGGGGISTVEPYDIVFTANANKVVNGVECELLPMNGTAKLAMSDYPELLEKTKALVNQPVARPPEFVGTDYAATMVRYGDTNQIVVDFSNRKVYKVGGMLDQWTHVSDNFPGGPSTPHGSSGNYGEYPLVSTNSRQTLLTYRLGYDGDESKIFRSTDGALTWTGVMGNPEGADYGLSFSSANLMSASGQMPGFVVAAMKDAIGRNAIVWSDDGGATWHLLKMHTLVPDDEFIVPHVSFDGQIVLLMTGRKLLLLPSASMTLGSVINIGWPGYTQGEYYTVVGAAVDWGSQSGFILTQEKLFGWNSNNGIQDIKVVLDEPYAFNLITQGDGAGAIITGNSGDMISMVWNGMQNDEPIMDRVKVSEQGVIINAITFIPPNSPNSPDIVYMSANNQNLTGNHFAMYQVLGLMEGNFTLPDAKLGPFAKIIIPPLREPE